MFIVKLVHFLVSTLPTSISVKQWQRSIDLSLQNLFFFFLIDFKKLYVKFFILTTCNISPVAIPEIFAQTQGSNYWQPIDYCISQVCKEIITSAKSVTQSHTGRASSRPSISYGFFFFFFFFFIPEKSSRSKISARSHT